MRGGRIFGMTPVVALLAGWVAWRWWTGQRIIPTLGMDIEGLDAVNAFPNFSGLNAFPTLGDLGAAAPAGSHAAVPLARRLMTPRLPYSRLR